MSRGRRRHDHHLPGGVEQRATDMYERPHAVRRVEAVPHVTLPMISGALFFTFIIQTISAFQSFDEAYTAFFGNQQTRRSVATQPCSTYHLFQQAFQFFHMGYASALAWLLFVIIMIITAIQCGSAHRFVYYEGATR